MKAIELMHEQNGTTPSTQPPTPLITREQIEETPFYIVGNEETGYAITFGQHKITEPTNTIQECIAMINKRNYTLIVNLVIALMHIHDQLKTQENARSNNKD